MSWLVLLTLSLAALSYWAGFKAAPHPAQYLSKSGFFVFLALALFSSYFAYREHSTISELGQIIEPVPGITEVTYIPTQPELSAITTIGTYATPPQQKDSVPKHDYSSQNHQPRYWMVTTSLPMNAVIDFYRDTASKTGWEIKQAALPWMRFARKNERLSIFISANNYGGGSTILYTFVLQNNQRLN